MSIAIETHNLSRSFESYKKPEGLINSIKGFWNREMISKIALEKTNIKIEAGQIVGLVGANGAGKTTLLKLLSGLITPSSGEALVLGYHPSERKYEFLKRISILLGQKNQLWWDIAPIDSYALLAKIYDLDTSKSRKRVFELAKLLDCTHVLETQLRRLSLGERMKMEIIGSLLHEPDVLFLDEPTIGLDIIAQSTIREFLADYVKQKSPTVILTSHYMDDIAKLSNQLLLISKGNIVFDGSVDSFMKNAESLQSLTFHYNEPVLNELTIAGQYKVLANQKEYQLKIQSKDLSQVLIELARVGQIHDLKIEETDFEDVIKGFLEKESRTL